MDAALEDTAMSRLRLRRAEAGASPDDRTERDVLPFPIGWRDGASDARTLAADLLEAEAVTAELEDAIDRMQREVDDLRGELDDALHLPGRGEWRPPAA